MSHKNNNRSHKNNNREILNALLSHASLVDEQLNFTNFTGKKLHDWMQPLAQSFRADGAVSYFINDPHRYRASPLASILSWMNSASLLPADVLNTLQDELIHLRDHNIDKDRHPNPPTETKLPEDKDGWALGEDVSVWSTSMAIIALLDANENGPFKGSRFKNSVLWLANQQSTTEKGWAYQSSANCPVNPVMTSLALRAIALSMSSGIKERFSFSSSEITTLETALSSGYEYLKRNFVSSRNKGYWQFKAVDKTVPHCAATVWALLALQQLSRNNPSQYHEFFNENLDKCLAFVLSKIPSTVAKWSDEQFVCEGGAKYDRHKNYHSYSATLISQLLSLGVSPYHPKIINQLKWLLQNPTEWKITGYDKNVICTFTYAMIISVLAIWSRKVGSVYAELLLQSRQTCFDRASMRILGMPYVKGKNIPVQLIRKNRLIIYAITLLTLIIYIISWKYFNSLVQTLASYIADFWASTSKERHETLRHDFIVLIYVAILGAIGWFIRWIWKTLCR